MSVKKLYKYLFKIEMLLITLIAYSLFKLSFGKIIDEGFGCINLYTKYTEDLCKNPQ